MTYLENLLKNGFIYLPNFYDKQLIDNAKQEIISKEKEIVDKIVDKTFNKFDYGIENNS